MAKTPARYLGHPVVLPAIHGPYFDGEGNLKTDLRLHAGDTLMIDESEARGDSHFIDPRHIDPPVYLGTGKVVKDETTPDGRRHADLSDAELNSIGYVFSSGRGDFEEIVSSDVAPQVSSAVEQPPPTSVLAEASTEVPSAQPHDEPSPLEESVSEEVQPSASVAEPAASFSTDVSQAPPTEATSEEV